MIVGEASYLSGRDASARVVVDRGCSYIRWTRQALRDLEEHEHSAGLHERVEVWLGLALSEKLRKTTATFVASHHCFSGGCVSRPWAAAGTM